MIRLIHQLSRLLVLANSATNERRPDSPTCPNYTTKLQSRTWARGNMGLRQTRTTCRGFPRNRHSSSISFTFDDFFVVIPFPTINLQLSTFISILPMTAHPRFLLIENIILLKPPIRSEERHNPEQAGETQYNHHVFGISTSR